MKVWYGMYGDDADGNRGVMATFSELDDSPEEREQIIGKLTDIFKADWCLSLDGHVSLELHDDIGEGEYEHDVDPEDYAVELIAALREDDDGTEPEYTVGVRSFEIEFLKRSIGFAIKRVEQSEHIEGGMAYQVRSMLAVIKEIDLEVKA